MNKVGYKDIINYKDAINKELMDKEAPKPMYDEVENDQIGRVCVWSTYNDVDFCPTPKTIKNLPPAVYDVLRNSSGEPYFQKNNDFSSDSIIQFKDAESTKVINDIRQFWSLEEEFKKAELVYKRGILLYGPPGGGKTSIIKLAIKDVIDNNGIAVLFKHPSVFQDGMSAFRSIQPDTPVVVVMEDVDSLLNDYPDSSILNVLDGVNNFEKICFIATTNYPEKLEPRVKNRPSRFDRRYKIDTPCAATRKEYISILFSKIDLNYDVDEWVNMTKGLSMAHIKELFISVHLYKNSFEESLSVITNMNKKVTSEAERKVGFSNGATTYS